MTKEELETKTLRDSDLEGDASLGLRSTAEAIVTMRSDSIPCVIQFTASL